MFKLFIWDLDNTLIGSSRLLWSAFGMVAEKYAGKRMTPEQIVSLYGPPEGAVIETIVGKNQKEEALEDFYRFYQNHHQELVDVFWEVLAIIPFLRSQGIFQAIFTSKGRRSADITLQMLQVTSLFDTVVCGDEIPRPKPYPDGVKTILTRLGIPPEGTLYFGDSPLDIQSARSAGVQGAMVLWDSFHRDLVEEIQPDYVFASIVDFKGWIHSFLPQGEKVTLPVPGAC